jgi:hypothetical protein
VDNSIPAWEQRDDESSLWFGRFYSLYLPLGPSRSINEAYRRFREQAQSGLNPATQLRAPGPWREAAVTYEWADRARSWDEEQRRIERQAHRDAVKATNHRHELLLRSRSNALVQAMQSEKRKSKWLDMSVTEERLWLVTLIEQERLLLAQQLLADDSRVVPAGQYTSHGNPAEHGTAPHQDRFAITDGELVSAFQELERREFVPEPTMEVETDAESCDREGQIRADQACTLAPQAEPSLHPAEPGLPEI